MSETYSAIATEVVSYSSWVSNPNNALTDTTSTTYATFAPTASTSSTSTSYINANLYLGWDLSSLPADAVIDSFGIEIKWYKSVSYSGSYKNRYTYTYFYIYPTDDSSNTTQLGSYSHTSYANVSNTTRTITCTSSDVIGKKISEIGSYTRLRCYARAGASAKTSGSGVSVTNTSRIYGAVLTVGYTAPSGVKVKVKLNGTWIEGIYSTKVNGAWVNADAIYVKENGTWIEAD